MLTMWTIKTVYGNGGGHLVRNGNEPYRFQDKQVAMDKVEALNALEKTNGTNTRYIVVPEE